MVESTVSSVISQINLQAIHSGLLALRAAKVEPMCLSINIDTSGSLAWSWYKFKALAGHPKPRNAGRGYSHPVHVVGLPMDGQAICL